MIFLSMMQNTKCSDKKGEKQEILHSKGQNMRCA